MDSKEIGNDFLGKRRDRIKMFTVLAIAAA
jgi:hypothetical protein